MSTLSALNQDLHVLPVIRWNPAAGQKLAVGASSSPSQPIGAEVVRLCSTTACWYATGAAPTAAASGAGCFLPANVIEAVSISPGDRIAVIQDAAGGSLSIVPAVQV